MSAKSKGSKRKIWAVAAVVIVLVIIVFSIRQLDPDQGYVAMLYVDHGDVQVMSNGKWQEAYSEMQLSIEDKVRTLEGEATLIFSDAIITNLEPHTEVSIKDVSDTSVTIFQESGSTWNKFLNIAGIKTFKVETPSTVATVRGTEFGIDVVDDNGEVYEAVLVAEGEVLFGMKQDAPSERLRAKRGEKLVLAIEKRIEESVARTKPVQQEIAYEVSEEMVESMPSPAEMSDEIKREVRKKIQRHTLTMKDRERMIKGVVKTVDRMKIIRQRQLEKNPELKQKLLDFRKDDVPEKTSAYQEDDKIMAEASPFPAPLEEREIRSPSYEEKLDMLAALSPEMLERIAKKLSEGGITMRESRVLMEIKRIREQVGMEEVNTINDRIGKQMELLRELQGSDGEMEAAARRVFEDSDFKNIIEPIVAAEKDAMRQLIESGALSDEEIQAIKPEKILMEGTIKENIIREETLHEQELLRKEDLPPKEPIYDLEEKPFYQVTDDKIVRSDEPFVKEPVPKELLYDEEQSAQEPVDGQVYD